MRRLIAFFVIPLLLGGGILLIHTLSVSPATIPSNGDGPSDAPTSALPLPTGEPSASPTATPTGDPDEGGGDGGDGEGACNQRAAIADFLATQGFSSTDYVVGHKVDWSKVSYVNNDDAFADRSLRTRVTLRRFLAADDPRSVAARTLIGNGTVNTDRYVVVQFLNPLSYSGNWYWKNGRARQGGDELVLAGDIWYASVDVATCTVDLTEWVRAVCGNIGLSSIMPAAKVD